MQKIIVRLIGTKKDGYALVVKNGKEVITENYTHDELLAIKKALQKIK